jgi:predicted NUDIX family phosphoesterase
MHAAATGELVLVVPRDGLLRLVGDDRLWDGVRVGSVDALLDLIAATRRFRPRADAEQDESTKQVIPYLALFDRGAIFLMRRTRAGADARLHERWSIGVGGHLHPDDVDPVSGLLREWREELHADWLPDPRPLGLLNDDSTPVGRVHLGLVYEAEADGRAVAIRETDKLEGAFADASEVRRVYHRLESWSQLLFDHLERSGRMG